MTPEQLGYIAGGMNKDAFMQIAGPALLGLASVMAGRARGIRGTPLQKLMRIMGAGFGTGSIINLARIGAQSRRPRPQAQSLDQYLSGLPKP